MVGGYLRKSFAAASLSLLRSRPIFRISSGLLKRDVMLMREVVCVVGGVRLCTSDAAASLFPLHFT
jgi:hypothetical protein